MKKIKEKSYIVEKRKELIWALSLQDYSYQDIGDIFGVHRSTVKRIVDAMPKNWTPKWVKVN